MDGLSAAASAITIQATISTFILDWQPLLSSRRNLGRKPLIIFDEVQDIRLLVAEFSTKMSLFNYSVSIQSMAIEELFFSITDIMNKINDLFRKILLPSRGVRSVKISSFTFEKEVQPFVERLEYFKARMTLVVSALNKDTQRLAMSTDRTSIEVLGQQQTKTDVRISMAFPFPKLQQWKFPTVSQPTSVHATDDRKTLKSDGSPILANDRVNAMLSPRWLHQVIGSVLLRIQRARNLSTEKSRTSRVDMQYMFPPWALNRCVHITYDSRISPNSSSQWSLGLHKVKPHLLWQHPGSATVEEVREAFVAGEASPFDIDSLGYNLLSHAIKAANIDLCAFLLQHGVDPFFANPITGELPILTAWNFVRKNYHKNNAGAHRMNDIFDGFDSLSPAVLDSPCPDEDENDDGTEINEAASDDANANIPEASTHEAEDEMAADPSVAGSSANQVALHESRDREIANGKHHGGITLPVETLLSLAASNEDTSTVKDLLLSGADPKASDARGWTPLHVAANNGDLKVAKLLLDAVELQRSQKMGLGSQSEALARATNMHGSPVPHRTLSHIDARDNGGRTPLTIAIRSERTEIALFLLQQGADIDLQDYYGRSPIFHALTYNNDKVMHNLLSRSCDLSFVGRDGSTFLHDAASFGNKSSLEVLIERIPELSKLALPNVNARDEQGRTALHCSEQALETNEPKPYTPELFQLLLKVIIDQDWKFPKQHKMPWFAALIMCIATMYVVALLSEREIWSRDARRLYTCYIGLLLWVFSSIWLISFIEIASSTYVWRRMKSAVAQLCRQKPVPEGHTRVQWICTCGEFLQDDFVEKIPGAAAKLEWRLRRQVPLSIETIPKKSRRGKSLLRPWRSNALNPAFADGRHLRTRTPGQDANGSVNANQQNAPGPTTGRPDYGPPRTFQPGNTNQRPPPNPPSLGVVDPLMEARRNRYNPFELQWLLMCSKPHKLPTTLSHLDLSVVYTDKALFQNVKQTYHDLKSAWHKWLSLRGVTSIRFVNFSLHYRNLVDIHPPIPDVPRGTRKEEYAYDPFHLDLLPPVGEERMTHLFHHPEHADGGFEVGISLPKKRKRRILPNDAMEDRVGWGVHLHEDWIPERVLALVLIVFVGVSLAFGICWTILKHDVSGAFAVSAWVLMLGAQLAAIIQFKVN